MEVHQLRGWMEFADKATIIALTIAGVAIIAAGTTSWLSFKYNRALREQDSAAALDHPLDRPTENAAKIEKELASLGERSAQLEKANAEANERAAEQRAQIGRLESAVEVATVRAAGLQLEVAALRARTEKSLAAVEPAKPSAQPPAVGNLQKFAGTKVAIYAVDEVPEAADVGSSINLLLTEAGLSSSTWKWTGVSGMAGVVVLTKEGIDPSMDQMAVATVDVLRSAGFNAVKASWPTDADWRKFRGTLSGPKSPDPTDAPIRVVVGARAQLH
jgi:hypothetical protein